MGKSQKVCPHNGPVLMCAELQLNSMRDPDCIAVYFSLAGSEGVLGLHWPLHGGRIDARTLEDLQAAMGKQLASSIETMLGIQGVLPMT